MEEGEMAELELNEAKQMARELWGAGDYPAIAELIADAGRKAVEAAAVSGDDTVLDVACGAGNATIPAAKTGADVTGLDITPRLLEAGKAEAADAGVEIEWVEGDAEQLPFEDASFDAVMSVFGCMFAPDHRTTAAEIARVMKPGGRMAICAWTPDGNVGRFFALTASHMPPPPEGFQPPVLWGTEEHVRELFEGTGVEPSFEQTSLEFVFESPEAVLEEYSTKLGPLVAAKAALEPEGKWQPLADELLALYEEANTSEGDLRFPGEYLVTTGTKS
jgi:ubiquinone/menaquinone biosynthesis C-methylase UbiE